MDGAPAVIDDIALFERRGEVEPEPVKHAEQIALLLRQHGAGLDPREPAVRREIQLLPAVFTVDLELLQDDLVDVVVVFYGSQRVLIRGIERVAVIIGIAVTAILARAVFDADDIGLPVRGDRLLAEVADRAILDAHKVPQELMQTRIVEPVGVAAAASPVPHGAVRHRFDQFVPRRVPFLHGRIMALPDQPRRLQRTELVADVLQMLSDVLGIDKA